MPYEFIMSQKYTISEAEIIKVLSSKSGGYIGDDAAVLPPLDQEQYIITKDLLIEDVHFRIDYFNATDLAYKSLHVNLSDLAAMGAKPIYILCGISIPVDLNEYAKNFLEQLTTLCDKYDVTLIGGDTTKSTDKLHISITAIGTTSKECIKYRSLAKTGDTVCVVGHLGYAHLGLTALEAKSHINAKYINAFLRPKAKIKEGIWLGQQPEITSMMDISDGLYIDLKRLCKSSSCGSLIELSTLEYDDEFENSCHALGVKPLDVILTGGEDYSLICTVSTTAFSNIAETFKKTFDYNLRKIGKIITGSSIRLKKNNNEFIELNTKPFTHFGEDI